MMLQLLLSTLIIALGWGLTTATRLRTQGNCVSGRIYLNSSARIYAGGIEPDYDQIDPRKFDMAIDYGHSNVKFFHPYGAELSLVKQTTGPASGTCLSSTRFILYGRITAKIRAIPYPSAITTLITMSQRKDEIDWELLGARPQLAETNVFYKGIPEYKVHMTPEFVPGGIQSSHSYTIDWTSKRISWAIDGDVKRTLYKANSTSPMTPPGERWFPSTPSQIQVSAWDAGGNDWAGGPIPWGKKTRLSAMYEYIDVLCYDDRDRPVASWPVGS